MIIEYFNESTDILASKVVNEEITLEEAMVAYNDLADKAINEYTNEVLDAVEEGVITPIEACFIFELCGIDEPVMFYTEADYDLSGLSAAEKKQIQDKLDSMPAAQRKKAEKALVQKFPSAEYKAKVEKRKKIAAGVGVAAGVGLAGAAAYGAHRVKKAEEFDKQYNSDYDKAKDHYRIRSKALASTVVGKAQKNDNEGKAARRDLSDMSNENRDDKIMKYVGPNFGQFENNHDYKIALTRRENYYLMTSCHDVTENKEVNCFYLASSQLNISNRFAVVEG